MADKGKQSFRITFEIEDVQFMKDYKEAFGISIQKFVEMAVKDKILKEKVKLELGE